jgi:uncharacterized secreted protein with C-terminal beta-propeller domain
VKLNSVILVLVIMLITGCSGSTDDIGMTFQGVEVSIDDLELKSSEGCQDLKNYLEASWLKQNTWAFIDRDIQEMVLTADGGHPDDVSHTNVQEPGVDEADWIKADREGNLYIVRGDFLVIEKGFPPQELNELSRLDLKASPLVMHLDEDADRIMIIGVTNAPIHGIEPLLPPDQDGVRPLSFPYPLTMELIFIDVSDLTQPRITQRLVLEGNYVGSRQVGARVHIVSRHTIQLPPVLLNDQTFLSLLSEYHMAAGQEKSEQVETLKRKIKDAIHNAIDPMPGEAFLPRAVSQVGDVETDIALLTCSDILRPNVEIDPAVLLVTSIHIDGSNPSALGITNNASLLYSGEKHLYLAQPSWGWRWDTDQGNQTAIYKFGISESKPVYLATGSIRGWVNDQFSFSEYNNFLRVASTEFRRDRETNRVQSLNHLFVLEAQPQERLTIVGRVRDFGVDERIFAVRFLDERGFVVTFRQIDPLFAFDLSDPFFPVLVGELEIPGFSTYIHPIDLRNLLTVGRLLSNLQLQIFNIGDLENPSLRHKYVPSDAAFSGSVAEYDHLAFTYYSPRELLIIPLTTRDETRVFSGLVVFRVSLKDGFTELGRVDHSDLAYLAYCSSPSPEEGWRLEACERGDYFAWAIPRRSVIMTSGEDAYLYSISDIGVKVTPVETLETVLGRVLFPS